MINVVRLVCLVFTAMVLYNCGSGSGDMASTESISSLKSAFQNDFFYQGKILNPVIGWTSHHSICAYEGK